MNKLTALFALAASIASAQDTTHGIDLKGMDRNVKVVSPKDLNSFANGKWIKDTPIPNDRIYVGLAPDVLERTQLRLKKICEREAAAKKPLNTVEGMVGLMYRLSMDEKRAERAGITPLLPELKKIDGIRDANGLMRVLADLNGIGVSGGFDVQVNQDDKDPTHNIFIIGQPEFILKDRDFYLKDDARGKEAVSRYFEVISTFLSLAKLPHDGATDALEMEVKFAEASSSPVQLRDQNANYHPMAVSDLRDLMPHTPWGEYFSALGTLPTRINVRQLGAMKRFDEMVTTVPMEQWRAFLRVKLLVEYAPELSGIFVSGDQYLKQLISGAKGDALRWSQATARVEKGAFGSALGQLYILETFGPEAKVRARRMIQNLQDALHDRISELDWMSPETKRHALDKLAQVRVEVGYPDKWTDLSDLHLQDDTLAENVIRIYRWEEKRALSSLKKPVDHSEWPFSPTTMNAFYSPRLNEVLFPAAILQKGFFDPEAEDAYNFGAIGAMIGHELTHGFDDTGSQFDGTGTRRKWWTPEDKVKFDAKGKEIVAQFSAYKSDGGLQVDGKLTEGENIADVGGLAIAYLAYRKSLNGVEPPVKDGLTGDQRFFVAYAQIWRLKLRPEIEKYLITNDTHAPETVRILGPVADFPPFYKAFGLPVPANLPHVW